MSKMSPLWTHKPNENCTCINKAEKQKGIKKATSFEALCMGWIDCQAGINQYSDTQIDRRLHFNPKTDCASLHWKQEIFLVHTKSRLMYWF